MGTVKPRPCGGRIILKKMKKTLRLLRFLPEVIDMDAFYAISIWKNDIKLQGRYKSETVPKIAKLINLGIDPESGYIRGIREVSGISISVTLA